MRYIQFGGTVYTNRNHMDRKPLTFRERRDDPCSDGVSPQTPQRATKTQIPFRSVDSTRERLLTTSQVSQWLEISPRTVCLWAELEEIPAFKLGHQWRFREKDIRQWLDNRSPRKTAE